MAESTVRFYFDPLCPFAWITSRWMLGVEQQRDVELTFHLMSLAILNENNDNEKYRAMAASGRPLGRVGIAIEQQLGQETLRQYYTALGERIHRGARDDYEQILAEVGAELELPAEVLAAATDEAYDAPLAASHEAAMQPVGADVGTPIMHLDGVAFFGPVLSSIPTGQAALDVFDGARLLASYPDFAELKRGRAGSPDVG